MRQRFPRAATSLCSPREARPRRSAPATTVAISQRGRSGVTTTITVIAIRAPSTSRRGSTVASQAGLSSRRALFGILKRNKCLLLPHSDMLLVPTNVRFEGVRTSRKKPGRGFTDEWTSPRFADDRAYLDDNRCDKRLAYRGQRACPFARGLLEGVGYCHPQRCQRSCAVPGAVHARRRQEFQLHRHMCHGERQIRPYGQRDQYERQPL